MMLTRLPQPPLVGPTWQSRGFSNGRGAVRGVLARSACVGRALPLCVLLVATACGAPGAPSPSSQPQSDAVEAQATAIAGSPDIQVYEDNGSRVVNIVSTALVGTPLGP